MLSHPKLHLESLSQLLSLSKWCFEEQWLIVLDFFSSLYTSTVSLQMASKKDAPDLVHDNKCFRLLFRVPPLFHFLLSLVLCIVGAPKASCNSGRTLSACPFSKGWLIQPIITRMLLGVPFPLYPFDGFAIPGAACSMHSKVSMSSLMFSGILLFSWGLSGLPL